MLVVLDNLGDELLVPRAALVVHLAQRDCLDELEVPVLHGDLAPQGRGLLVIQVLVSLIVLGDEL